MISGSVTEFIGRALVIMKKNVRCIVMMFKFYDPKTSEAEQMIWLCAIERERKEGSSLEGNDRFAKWCLMPFDKLRTNGLVIVSG